MSCDFSMKSPAAATGGNEIFRKNAQCFTANLHHYVAHMWNFDPEEVIMPFDQSLDLTQPQFQQIYDY